MKRVPFGVVANTIGVMIFGYLIGIQFFLYNAVLSRQSRQPDAGLGFTVSHELKGAIFYVTPQEDILLTTANWLFVATWLTIMITSLGRAIAKSHSNNKTK